MEGIKKGKIKVEILVKDIEKILSVLKKYDVKTTFFITGNWVEKYPEAVKKMQAAGHDLGNHSYHHKHMPELDAA